MALGECSVGGRKKPNDLLPDRKQELEKEAKVRSSTVLCRCSSSLFLFFLFILLLLFTPIWRESVEMMRHWEVVGHPGNVAMHANSISFLFPLCMRWNLYRELEVDVYVTGVEVSIKRIDTVLDGKKYSPVCGLCAVMITHLL